MEGKETKKELKHTEVATATDTLVEKQKALKPVDPKPVDPDPVDPKPVDPNPVDPDPVAPGKPSTRIIRMVQDRRQEVASHLLTRKKSGDGYKKIWKSNKNRRYNSGCTGGRRGTGLCNDASCKFSQKRKKTIEMKE